MIHFRINGKKVTLHEGEIEKGVKFYIISFTDSDDTGLLLTAKIPGSTKVKDLKNIEM